MDSIDPVIFFKQNKVYRKSEIHERFGGQSQSGISTPRQFPVIFLFHTPTGVRYGYQDGWSANGTYLYRCEGTKGDIKLERGNLAIRDHRKNKEHILLFEESKKRGHYQFLGEFTCIGYEDVKTVDESGELRRGIVFELMPIDQTADLEDDTTLDVEDDLSTPLAMLRAKAFDASEYSPTDEIGKKAVSTYYRRSDDVRRYVKRRALGFCEGCGEPAPFKTKKGNPYLEAHHVIRRADKGPDSPDTVIALCPNCHKRIDQGKDSDEYTSLLKERVRHIEDKQDKNTYDNVACAIILDDSRRVLIAQRSENNTQEGCWEFVGGKIEDGETIKDCLKREVYEELKINIKNIVPYHAVYYDYYDSTVRLLAAVCAFDSGDITLKDHSKYEWILINNLKSYDLCPADKSIAEKIDKIV